MTTSFSYRHLYYFWVVAKEGGVTRAAVRLGVAAQTVSTQVRELEQTLGCALLKPSGRGLALTEAGFSAMQQADLIFQLGEQLPARVRDAAAQPIMRLSVGVADALPKLVVRRLMQPVLEQEKLKLICRSGAFADLLAELALHRIDVVLADRAAPSNSNLRLYSHPLESSTVAWYATSALRAMAESEFPQSLAHLPLLMPNSDSAVCARLQRWFERHAIEPRIVGEFADSALLKAFGASGMGAFPASELVHDDLLKRYGVGLLGRCEGVNEHFFAVATEKRVQHPLVQRLLTKRAGNA